MFQPRHRSDEEKIGAEIADAFTHEAVEADLDGHGLSELATQWNGRRVCVSWFSTGDPFQLKIDGDDFFPKGQASTLIFKAAIARAGRLLDEKLRALAQSKD